MLVDSGCCIQDFQNTVEPPPLNDPQFKVFPYVMLNINEHKYIIPVLYLLHFKVFFRLMLKCVAPQYILNGSFSTCSD